MPGRGRCGRALGPRGRPHSFRARTFRRRSRPGWLPDESCPEQPAGRQGKLAPSSGGIRRWSAHVPPFSHGRSSAGPGPLSAGAGRLRGRRFPAYAPCGEGTHTYVLIEKRKIPTMEAVRRIAARLGRRAEDIGSAGLKDARALVRQTISIEHLVEQERARIDDDCIRALAFSRHTNKLQPGHLWGNRFRISLRDVRAEDEERARAVLARLECEGVPNYFGAQRFGTRANTHRVGLALLRGEFAELLAMLCGRPADEDSPRLREARAAPSGHPSASSVSRGSRAASRSASSCPRGATRAASSRSCSSRTSLEPSAGRG